MRRSSPRASQRPGAALLIGALATGAFACDSAVPRPPAPDYGDIYSFAGGCYVLDATDPGSDDTRWLRPSEDGASFEFAARDPELASRLVLKASDLGTYLLRDAEGHTLVAEDGGLGRAAEILSDVLLIDDDYVSPAEWEVTPSSADPTRLSLVNLATGEFVSRLGLTSDPAEAAVLALYPADGCQEFPELTVDADGEVVRRAFDDDDVFGVVDTHSHLLSNFGFGGGGIFHGAPFHRLGVEHALPDCALYHGTSGRRDLFGFGYDQGDAVDPDDLLTAFVSGRTPQPNHVTDGYPDFTEWPDARRRATHQQQYYRWLERAYLGGLRLVVQHATTNSVVCDLVAGGGSQRVRYSCNDMVAVDRSIEEVYRMERYIDAQEGGPGRGWFRIVSSPEEAREVIRDGRMAVILGIEVSNLFDCFVTPREGFPACTEASVREALDRYHELGVRVLFPVHKYDNAFSAGDGDRAIIELGNFINSSHYSNFVEDCDSSIPTVFDRGPVAFGGLNMPRADYLSPAPNDLSRFPEDPLAALTPFLSQLMEPALEGDYCQNAGLTPLGEALISEVMTRGMVLEIDHFPRRAYARVFELLEANDYPAAGTHGINHGGRLYALGGVSKTGLGRCRDPERPGAMGDRLRDRVATIVEQGGYPAEGFGFDFNGFAGAAGPRMGPRSVCSEPQSDPLTYPFTSYAGDVTFTEPRVGNRVIDFNTEGMVHIGLMPELIEDARRGGVADEELEPLFRSAEGYLRMWERAERRAAEMR